jgi:hypothetical protein
MMRHGLSFSQGPVQAHRYLESHGINPSDPKADELALDSFFDVVEEKLPVV